MVQGSTIGNAQNRTRDESESTGHSRKLIPTSALILDYLRKEKRAVTRLDIVQNVPRSYSAIDKALQRLKHKGDVVKVSWNLWSLPRLPRKSAQNRTRDESEIEGGGSGLSDLRFFDPRKPIKRHNLQFYVKGHPNTRGKWSDFVEWSPASVDVTYVLKFYGRKNGRIDLYVNCSNHPLYPTQLLQLLEFARGYLRFGLGINDPRFVWVNWDTNQDHLNIHYRGKHLEIEVFEGTLYLALYGKKLPGNIFVTRTELKERNRSLDESEAELLLLREESILQTGNMLRELGDHAIENMKHLHGVMHRFNVYVNEHQSTLSDLVSTNQLLVSEIARTREEVGIVHQGVSEIVSYSRELTQVLEQDSETKQVIAQILSRLENRTNRIEEQLNEVISWRDLDREQRAEVVTFLQNLGLSINRIARLLNTYHSTISRWMQRIERQQVQDNVILNNKQQQVLEYIREHPGCTSREIRTRVRVHRNTLYTWIHQTNLRVFVRSEIENGIRKYYLR